MVDRNSEAYMRNAPRTARSQVRQAFTLVELLVVIGIIALLISVLLPALSKARQQANSVACSSNLRQLGIAMQLYVNAYQYYPGHIQRLPNDPGKVFAVWPTRLRKMMNVKGDAMRMFRCPERPEEYEWRAGDTSGVVATANEEQYGYNPGESLLLSEQVGRRFSYGYNDWGAWDSAQPPRGLGGDLWLTGNYVKATRVRVSSDVIAISETTADGGYDFNVDPTDITPADGLEAPFGVHRGSANVLYADGHVVAKPVKDLVLYTNFNGNLITYGKSSTNWLKIAPQWNNDHKP